MDVNQGTHASSKLLGSIGLDMGSTAASHIWGQARDWLDHYLKGLNNGISSLPAVQVQLEIPIQFVFTWRQSSVGAHWGSGYKVS